MNFLKKIISPLLCVLILFSCKSGEVSEVKIEGGIEHRPGEGDSEKLGSLPSMVGLLILQEGDKGGTCTGAVVGEGLILTAAHCVSGVNLSTDNAVSIQTTNGNSLGIMKMDSVDIHPSYMPVCLQLCADIALIKLKLSPFDKKALELNTRPAQFEYSPPKVGDQVLIAGFGCDERTTFSDCTPTMKKMFWKFQPTTVVGLSPALNLASEAYFSTDGKLGRGAEGDSGGPIFNKEGKIIGVNANYLKGFENSYHTSLHTEAVSTWLKAKVVPMKVNPSPVQDPRFVVKASERCLYTGSVSQPWLSTGNSKCPRQKDNPNLFNMTINVDNYRCGIPVLSDEAIVTRGIKICRTTYSCLTAPYVNVNQAGC